MASARAPGAGDAPHGARAAPSHGTTASAPADPSAPASHQAPRQTPPAGPAHARAQAAAEEDVGATAPRATLPAPPALPGVPQGAQPWAPATGHPHRRAPAHAITTRPVDRHRAHDAARDGVPLQTLLAAAHPLAAPAPPAGDAVAAPSSTAPALTPHDVAASVQGAWLRETRLPTADGVASQWTFALGDPLTPLAALRVSASADGGWALQLTAGQGLPASQLAPHVDRLRQRLRARGQAVERLEVDDDTENAS